VIGREDESFHLGGKTALYPKQIGAAEKDAVGGRGKKSLVGGKKKKAKGGDQAVQFYLKEGLGSNQVNLRGSRSMKKMVCIAFCRGGE